MFTGIIEEIGAVKSFSRSDKNASLTIECKEVLKGTKIGDSIAINGVCQTVTEIFSGCFTAQVSAETLSVTNFLNLKTGDKVNLERALTLNSRLGGHIVSGHIDGKAKLKKIEKLADFYNLKFEAEPQLIKYIVKKGSITINGISLTISDIISNEFNIALIPHTFKNTNLEFLKIGDFVNVETDILAKYVENFLSTGNNETIDENFLKENGFF